MTASHRTAREQRETRRADASRSLARVLLAHDLSHAEVARVCGVSETIVHEWCDATKPRALSVADAMALPAATRVVLAELLAGAGHYVSHVPSVEAAADIAHAIKVQVETHDVLRVHLEAVADGVLSRADARVLRLEIVEAQRALAALERACLQADREGVVSLRRVG